MKQKFLYGFVSENISDTLVNINETIKIFEEHKFNSYMFKVSVADKLSPDKILNIIETGHENINDKSLFFMTDNINLLKLMHRLYHQLFENFIFIENSQFEHDYLESDYIYEIFLKQPFKQDECINKPIYCLNDSELKLETVKIKNITQMFLAETEELKKQICKIYLIEDKYYLFEPLGEEIVIINFENKDLIFPIYERLEIYFNYNIEIYGQINKLINYFKTVPNFYKSNSQTVSKAFYYMKEIIESRSFFEKLYFLVYIDLIKLDADSYVEIFLESFELSFIKEPKDITYKLLKIYNIAMNSNLSPVEIYFVCMQGVTITFRDSRLGNEQTNKTVNLIRQKTYEYLKSQVSLETNLLPIHLEERDEEFIVVLTSQFLGLDHGPTKTALDRCYTLSKYMNKKVMLICTRDMLAPSGEVPFYQAILPMVEHEYCMAGKVDHKDISIPFYQSEVQMPNIHEIVEIISYIKQTKPYLIVSIGEGLIADLLDGLVPVITISTVPSVIPPGCTTFKVIGRKLSLYEIENMKKNNLQTESIIESVFTSSFISQKNTFTRKELGLPEDKFLLLVVGGRLDYEVTNEFLEILLHTVNLSTYLVFMGRFVNYSEKCCEIPGLKENSTFLGFQNDALAINEICDLYVNPKRLGGGTSVAEAMFKGLPPVSLDYGDVSVGAGKEFCVNNYEEMAEQIKKYVKDREFYELMSEKAKQRVTQLMDTNTHFSEIINKVLSSKLFR